MESPDRVVITIPLESVRGADGHDLRFTREGLGLSLDEVKGILREAQTVFVVADVGEPLVWVEGDDVFPFWKAEVSSRLANPRGPAYLDDFPGGYCYFAELWKGPDGHVVVLATFHLVSELAWRFGRAPCHSRPATPPPRIAV